MIFKIYPVSYFELQVEDVAIALTLFMFLCVNHIVPLTVQKPLGFIP